MSDTDGVVILEFAHCGNCGAQLGEKAGLALEARKPCPSCGSLARRVDVDLTATVRMHANLAGVQRRPGFKSSGRRRPVAEFIAGIVKSATFGHVKKEWLLDRGTRRYRERAETLDGVVLRDVDEPLDDHRGRGSAGG